MRYSIVPNVTKTALVKAVHDGDSMKVKFEDGEVVWIRLYGCDAPEVVSNHVSANQPYGVESGKFLRELTKGSLVTVHTLFKDKYNRLICRVDFELPTEEDTPVVVDLSEYLIETGNAWWLTEPRQDKTISNKLKELQKVAKTEKNGLWGGTDRKLRPSTWRKDHKRFSSLKLYEDLW